MDKDGELVPKIENVDLVKVHCNAVHNTHQQASNILFTSVSSKKFGQLMFYEPKSPIILKTINSEFSYIEIFFTNQDNKPLEIEGSVSITLIVGTGKALI